MAQASGEPSRALDTDPLAGGGEMGALMRSLDWSRTPVGPVETWPQSLRTAVSILLESRFPMYIAWGPRFVQFYNDGYRPILGSTKHPSALGNTTPETFREIWPIIGPMFADVMSGIACGFEDLLLPLDRHGYVEECYFTFSYSPIRDESGGVGGVHVTVTETTSRVLGERRLRTLRDLAAQAAEVKTESEAWQDAAQVLAENPTDLPFALLYRVEPDGGSAVLTSWTTLRPGDPAAPPSVDLRAPSGGWPLAEVAANRVARVVSDLAEQFGEIIGPSWPEPVKAGLVLAITRPGLPRPYGLLVLGINPRRSLDSSYRDFCELVAGHLASGLASARAHDEERRRAEALAELDRAKTVFFSNVSHEFRTPLTLMLGPLEELLGDARLPEAERAQVGLIHRNGLRLLRLVNTLLDFSRIEAGRIEAVYEPVDLAAYTAELASAFRSAVERAGLRLVVDCPSLPGQVYVDQQMWEKIVLNLISNAFKFTFEGEIRVRVGWAGDRAELEVSDTGCGIPDDELPRIFERFHRARSARSRTHEGTGIGLSLVEELVKLHGGTISVESSIGAGTTFRISVPAGTAHLPSDRVGGSRTRSSTAIGAASFVEEALRWLPEAPSGEVLGPSPDGWSNGVGTGPRVAAASPWATSEDRPRILVADDNADLREYLQRLLSAEFVVESVSDGASALAAARAQPPDLVVADVMMPGLDGFELLRSLRSEAGTREVPVILLSARAGEESRLEGLAAGADDYLVKPFSARELVARVGSHLQLARVRRETQAALREGEQRLQLALEAARMVAWEWDPATDRVATSSNLPGIYGVPEISTAEQGFGLIHPDDVERHRATVERAVREASPYQSEFRVIRPDTGEIVWLEERGEVFLDAAGAVRRLAGVVVDVTARRRAEEALRASEERFRTLVDANVIGIVVADTEQILEANQVFLDMVGYSPADLEAGRLRWREMTPPEHRAVDEESFAALVATGACTPFEKEYFRRDGSRVPVLLGAAALAGLPQRWICFVLDLSGQKAVERARREFLANVSHELRNPLSSIKGYAQLMRRRGRYDERSLDAVIAQANQLERLVSDLLAASSLERGQLELRHKRVDLVGLARDCAEQAAGMSSLHAIRVEAPTEPIEGDWDPDRLGQVFRNLLGNAIKYSPSGGEVLVHLERRDGEVRTTIRDRGVGIEPRDLERLFERFYRGGAIASSVQGLGLGLYITRDLIEAHGGRIWAESAGRGQGSSFVFTLPLDSEQAGGVSSAEGGR